jgi:hypothetical protein
MCNFLRVKQIVWRVLLYSHRADGNVDGVSMLCKVVQFMFNNTSTVEHEMNEQSEWHLNGQ